MALDGGNGRVRIPLAELSAYLAAQGLEITGTIGAPRALVVELAPAADGLPTPLPPDIWTAPDRDVRLAAHGYRLRNVRTLRDGTLLFDLAPLPNGEGA